MLLQTHIVVTTDLLIFVCVICTYVHTYVHVYVDFVGITALSAMVLLTSSRMGWSVVCVCVCVCVCVLQ